MAVCRALWLGVVAMGGVWWTNGPLQWPKPPALGPPGCYPRCPKDRPIYDEDLKKCVTADKCGCYVGDTHYPPGASVPAEKDCHSWYLGSGCRGPGGGQVHAHAHLKAVRTSTLHVHGCTHARTPTCPPAPARHAHGPTGTPRIQAVGMRAPPLHGKSRGAGAPAPHPAPHPAGRSGWGAGSREGPGFGLRVCSSVLASQRVYQLLESCVLVG